MRWCLRCLLCRGLPVQVLLLMKHVSRSGRAEFRRCLQKHAEAVKGCLRECFSGAGVGRVAGCQEGGRVPAGWPWLPWLRAHGGQAGAYVPSRWPCLRCALSVCCALPPSASSLLSLASLLSAPVLPPLPRPLAEFRAALDPLRGDEPARRVREAAKEALEAMYEGGGSAGAASGAASALGARITGYSSAAGGAGASPYPSALPSSGAAAGGGAGYRPGFSTALPGQPGYDPASPLHAAPVTSGTMVGAPPLPLLLTWLLLPLLLLSCGGRQCDR